MLVKRGRIRLDVSIEQWVREALSKPGISLLDFSADIAIDAANLPEPMHKDPADRIIVASARVERLMLVTRDKEILQFARLAGLAHMQA